MTPTATLDDLAPLTHLTERRTRPGRPNAAVLAVSAGLAGSLPGLAARRTARPLAEGRGAPGSGPGRVPVSGAPRRDRVTGSRGPFPG